MTGIERIAEKFNKLLEWIRGRRILVTAAGGSIGAELCRQIARFGPAQLVLYEHNEFALYPVRAFHATYRRY